MAKLGKKYQEVAKLVDTSKKYSLVEAVELAKQTSTTKFDATVELVFRLNLDSRKAEQNLRGAIVLPHGTGKTRKVLVLTKGPKAKEAQEAGADYVGDAEYLDKIKGGWFEFDIIVATPDMMGELGKLGKLLGPKGLMPNAKTGTVTVDVEKAVSEVKAGRVEYRTDSFGNVHGIIGNTDFTEEKLVENMDAFMATLLKVKPATVKGEYVKNISIASTMGPGIKVSSNSFDK